PPRIADLFASNETLDSRSCAVICACSSSLGTPLASDRALDYSLVPSGPQDSLWKSVAYASNCADSSRGPVVPECGVAGPFRRAVDQTGGRSHRGFPRRLALVARAEPRWHRGRRSEAPAPLERNESRGLEGGRTGPRTWLSHRRRRPGFSGDVR